jgi:ABC-2 type transport system permease protein
MLHEHLRAALTSAHLEFRQLRQSRLLVVLTVAEAITFLVLVSLFGLTGSRAPTGLVNEDGGPLAASLIAHLRAAHHSFDLRPMSASAAQHQLRDGQLVAAITIPPGFSAAVARGDTVVLPVDVDNVDADLTDDIERAVPSAVTGFGRDNGFPGVRVVAAERDLLRHDTGYIPYLVVSALALDAFVVAGVLGAVCVTREWESGTIIQWRLAPASPAVLLAGKLLASAAVSAVAVAVAAFVVMAGYGVAPLHAFAMLGALALCVAVFTLFGAAVGALLRRTAPVVPLFFGLALPLYIDSGALEPERFDGTRIWALAHLSPVYYAVGGLEWAAHGLRVTPEPVVADVLVLGLWALVGAMGASAALSRSLAVSTRGAPA